MNTSERIDKAGEKVQDFAEQAEQARRSFKEKARALGQKAQDWQRQAMDTGREVAQNTDNYVRENPWNAIAYVGIGCFLLGWLIGRNRD